MRILVCYKLYLREGDPGIRRFNELCQIWSETGEHEVYVVAGMFNHQLGRVYPDLAGQSRQWENDGTVRVLRLSSPDTYNKGFAGRFWSQYRWAKHAERALSEVPAPDVVIGTSPTLWVALPLLAAKKRWRIPGVFEVRDLWPDVIVQMGVAKASNPAVRYLRHLERKVTSGANHIVTIVQRQKDQMVERGLVPSEKVSVFPNGIMLDKYEAVPADARQRLRRQLDIAEDAFVVLFIGAVSRGHDAMRFVDLAQALRDDPQIRLVCIGDGPDKAAMQSRTAELRLANLSFHDSVPTNAVPEYYSIADAGCVLGHSGSDSYNVKLGNFRNTFFDVAGAKLPVVFNVPGFPVEEIQDRARGGIFCFTEHNADELAAAVRKLKADPQLCRELGENNYREIAVRYNRRKIAAEYLELLQSLRRGEAERDRVSTAVPAL